MVSTLPNPSWAPGAEEVPEGRSHPVDAPTFRTLYVEHLGFVWRNLKRLGVPPEQLEDAAHDVFVVVHRRLDDYRPDHSPKAWLFAITRRVASDQRRRVRRKGNLAPLPEALIARDGLRPDEAASRHEASAIVRAFLEELDDAHREIFVLAELEQMTAPEIAAATEMPQTRVYARIRSARKALKRFVSERFPDLLEERDDG